MKREDLRKLLSLDSTIDITKVEVKKEDGKTIKYVYVKSNRKKLGVKTVIILVIRYMTI